MNNANQVATLYPLDHIALRVLDRDVALPAFARLGYKVVESFPITLEDGSTAQSYALEKPGHHVVFISSGPPESKIHRWVTERGGRGAVHHFAFVVESVAQTMEKWKEDGVVFTTDKPIVCSCEVPLTQVFTEEDPTTGLVYELIERNGHPGFCQENVAKLMSRSST